MNWQNKNSLKEEHLNRERKKTRKNTKQVFFYCCNHGQINHWPVIILFFGPNQTLGQATSLQQANFT